jgi:hypothetical protein
VAVDSYGGFNRIWSPEDNDIACCEGDGSIPRAETSANETLIAAAPELLETLEELHRKWHSMHDSFAKELDRMKCGMMHCSKVAAAIRKAKGE